MLRFQLSLILGIFSRKNTPLNCNNLNVVDPETIKNFGPHKVYICMQCSNSVFPFRTIKGYKLYQTLNQNNNQYGNICEGYSTKTCSALKPTKNLSSTSNKFNNFFSQQNQDTEMIQTLNIIKLKFLTRVNPERVNNINSFIKKYDWKEIDFPSHNKDWKAFE